MSLQNSKIAEQSVTAVFHDFEVNRVLSENDRSKTIAVLGRWRNKPDQAIVILSKQPFDASNVHEILCEHTATALHFNNDIYAKYTGTPAPQQSFITIDTIYPASHKHISKHSAQQYVMVTETAEHYQNAVRPYIQLLPASRIQWVYNILDKTAEANRLLFEDSDVATGFLLHPDLKWDQKQAEGMYCIALCNRRDILSLRDLDADHLKLLNNIKIKACQAITDKFGVAENQIRAYVHYHPSYYHFHVHLMHVKVDAGAGMAVGKAHLLDDIIENIAMRSNYYAERTLSFSLGDQDPLFKECFATSSPEAEQRQKRQRQ